MDDSKRIDRISVDGKFGSVIRILKSQLDALDKVCDSQVLASSLNENDIKIELGKIDAFITNNPAIQDAMIEGSADVKAIIESINLEVADRMKNFKANFRNDADKTKIDDTGKDFSDNSQINKKVKNLEDFEANTFDSKSSSDREKDAKNEFDELSKRFEIASIYKDMKAKDPTLDENKMIQSAVDSDEAIQKMDRIERRQNIIMKNPDNSPKQASDYEKIVSDVLSIANKSYKISKGYKIKISKDDIKKLNEALKTLKTIEISGDSNVKDLIAKIEANATISNGKITNIDTNTFGNPDQVRDPKFKSIDFDKVITDVPIKTNEYMVKELKTLLDTQPIFSLNPELKKQYTDLLNGTNPNVSFIKEQISKYVADPNLADRISQAETDRTNLNTLEIDKLKAEKRANNLNSFNNKQSTTTVKIFGQDLDLMDSAGNSIDFSKITTDEDRDRVVSELYDKFSRGDQTQLENYVESNKTSLVSYKKPSLFSRVLYKLNPAHWKAGDNLMARREAEATEMAKENATKGAIIDQLKSMQDKPAWYLTPEDAQKVQEAQKEITEKAKKKGRKDIVLSGKSSKDAQKDANAQIRNEQNKSDEDLVL